ncbi:hypothetical protein UPYG_G00142970, partial [Umbra pygmaea]
GILHLFSLNELKYKKDLNKLRGSFHFHNLTSEDNLALKSARNINKIVSEVEYKKDLENTKGHSINYCDTPQYKNASKAAKFISDNKYKEKYTSHMKGHYEGSGIDKNTLHAMKVRKLASNIAYKQEYEQDKTDHGEYNYPATITPGYQSQKKLDHLKDRNYKQHIDQVKYKLVTDTPDIIQARMNSHQLSNAEYKKRFKENQSQFSLSIDMVNLSHAKKAQALASDLDYRTKLHDYTILSDDIKVQQAKKAYNLQSENQYRSDLNWMKGVGWEADGCLNVTQAKKAGELLSDKKYRQKVDSVKFTQVADTPSIKQAKKNQKLQSKLLYKAGNEQMMHQYTMDKDEPLFRQAKANADLLSGKVYKSSWEKQREKGFELHLDSLSILTAKAKTDLASTVKYKEKYEQSKGKMIGVKMVTDDSQMAHSALASRLQSDRNYRKDYEDTKTKHSASLDMLTLTHAKKAQNLATETNYRTFLHKYTTLPGDMKVAWAKKAYGLLSDVRSLI